MPLELVLIRWLYRPSLSIYVILHRVTTETPGQQLLIHKGSGYGKSSQTVVVDAKHMSNKWTVSASASNSVAIIVQRCVI